MRLCEGCIFPSIVRQRNKITAIVGFYEIGEGVLLSTRDGMKWDGLMWWCFMCDVLKNKWNWCNAGCCTGQQDEIMVVKYVIAIYKVHLFSCLLG